MNEYSYPTCYDKVHFQFHLPALTAPCMHVNYIEMWSSEPGEQEFLFPPYSSFKAISIEWISQVERISQGFWQIDLEVMQDNKALHLEDVVTCPWC